MSIRWRDYQVKGFYDELLRGTGRPHAWARRLCRYFSALTDEELRMKKPRKKT